MATRPRWSLLRWLDRLQPSGDIVMAVAAAAVGLFAGAGVWLFRRAIDAAHALAFGVIGTHLAATSLPGAKLWSVALLPILGGLVVGLVMHFLVGHERHHGVAGIMEAVALAGGRLRYYRIPAKVGAAALSIGFGAPVGPEDPSVQVGAGLGSMFGQLLRVSEQRVQSLVAAGAAAGLAAAFNAPIAGVFFALEVILGEIGGRAFGTVVLAAVVSSTFTQAVSGSEPAFHVPHYAFHSARELPFYLVLGVVAGLVGALYVRTLYAVGDRFRSWQVPGWLKPASAGVLVGAVGMFLPQVFGVGYDTIESALGAHRLTLGLLVALLVGKLILTPVAIGGGYPGGVFAPSLFLGAMLGAAFGSAADMLFPSVAIDPPAFALVGMAAVLAAAVHAPLTATILLFEMTNDYRIILPLMLAVTVSLVLSQRLQRESVYTLSLVRKGIRIRRGRDVDVLEGLTVGEVMQRGVAPLDGGDSLDTALRRFLSLRHLGLPVVEEGRLIGVLTVHDVERAQAEQPGVTTTAGEVCTRNPLVAFPDETIGEALRRMSARDIGRLPVVSRADPQRLVGILRGTDVTRAYSAALARRTALRQSVEAGTEDEPAPSSG